MTSSASLSEGEWISRSPEETFSIGADFGGSLTGGEIILVTGPLGAGKTLFVKGLASSLDVDTDDVTSPSFTLVNLYSGRLKLYHLDLYRLPDGNTAAHAVDLDGLIEDERAVVVIEWAERLGGYRLPSPVWRIEIRGDGDEDRQITIKCDRTLGIVDR